MRSEDSRRNTALAAPSRQGCHHAFLASETLMQCIVLIAYSGGGRGRGMPCSGSVEASRCTRSFHDLRARYERGGNRQAYGLGCSVVDHQLERCWLLDG